MTSLVLIETNGTIKTLKAKELTTDTLYKKCGFRVNDDFLCRHTWRVNITEGTHIVSVWAKKNGKANFENKYDFPPPIDKDLFFGTCAIVRTDEDGAFLDLTKEIWLKIYEKLFGGFEDIGDEDEYSEDELANVDPSLLTANGYLKDGFVVSDKECISSGATSDTEVEPEVKLPKKKVKGTSKGSIKEICAEETTKKKVKKASKNAVPTKSAVPTEPESVKPKSKKPTKNPVKVKSKPVVNEHSSDSEGTTSELEEEVYTFSDDD